MSAEVMNKMASMAVENGKALKEMQSTVKALTDTVQKTRANNHPDPNQVLGGFGAPNVRNGEDPMSSRGFSFMKMLGVITGCVRPENAKLEIDVHNRLNNCYEKALGSGWYNYGGRMGEKAFMAPLATSYLHDEFVPANFRHEMKCLTNAGVAGADPDQMGWIRNKQLAAMGYGQKTLSWLTEDRGGALVAPPEFGELIELLRNKEALVNAGARTVPLPPQGRVKYPRQTGASTAYWVGENSPISASDVNTGEITLQAKKLAVLIKAPNELIRFASPAAEALMRDDMTKTLALTLDLAGLEGTGTDTRPRGVLNYPNINTVVSSNPGTDGDKIVPQDIYRMVAIIEENNAEFEAFIMRPKTLYKYYQIRSDAVGQGDQQGVFVYNLIREAGMGTTPLLGGYPVVKSTQVSQVQAKGASNNLTYILGGAWSQMLIGMFGAIEFAATTMGDTAFVNDQTWVRGILSADIQLRYESVFCLMQNLSTTL